MALRGRRDRVFDGLGGPSYGQNQLDGEFRDTLLVSGDGRYDQEIVYCASENRFLKRSYAMIRSRSKQMENVAKREILLHSEAGAREVFAARRFWHWGWRGFCRNAGRAHSNRKRRGGGRFPFFA